MASKTRQFKAIVLESILAQSAAFLIFYDPACLKSFCYRSYVEEMRPF